MCSSPIDLFYTHIKREFMILDANTRLKCGKLNCMNTWKPSCYHLFLVTTGWHDYLLLQILSLVISLSLIVPQPFIPRWQRQGQCSRTLFWWCGSPAATRWTAAVCGNTPGTWGRVQSDDRPPDAIYSSDLQKKRWKTDTLKQKNNQTEEVQLESVTMFHLLITAVCSTTISLLIHQLKLGQTNKMIL